MDEPVVVGRLSPPDWLGRPVRVVIDRPLGSVHPDGGFLYPVNYGFVPGFLAPDGEELDAYVLGPDRAIGEYEGNVVAVVLRRDDVEDKLVVSADSGWRRAAIADALDFQEQCFDSQVVTQGI